MGLWIQKCSGLTPTVDLRCVLIKNLIEIHNAMPRRPRILHEPLPDQDVGLVHIGKLTQLRHLDLSRNQIIDAGAAHLSGLRGVVSFVFFHPYPTWSAGNSNASPVRVERSRGRPVPGSAGREHVHFQP